MLYNFVYHWKQRRFSMKKLTVVLGLVLVMCLTPVSCGKPPPPAPAPPPVINIPPPRPAPAPAPAPAPVPRPAPAPAPEPTRIPITYEGALEKMPELGGPRRQGETVWDTLHHFSSLCINLRQFRALRGIAAAPLPLGPGPRKRYIHKTADSSPLARG